MPVEHEPGEDALEDHADQAAEQQPAEREAEMFGDPVEAGSRAQRQHPGDSAVVDPRLGGEEDADDDHRDGAADSRRWRSDRAGQPADRAEKLAADVGRLALRHEAERAGECHQPRELGGHDRAQGLGLGGDGRAREPEYPAEEAEPEQKNQDEPPAARDRQVSAKQAHAAIEENGEDRAADDEQQRLGEDDHADDGRPTPNHTAAFCISRRTRGSRNSAGPGRSRWGSVVGGRSGISCS